MLQPPEDLPDFAYHPDPVGTGSVKASDAECVCCSRRRGYVYVGAVYAVDELKGRLCPWCIADGTAADRFEAIFVDSQAPTGVATSVIETIDKRTPGFVDWQQERWHGG